MCFCQPLSLFPGDLHACRRCTLSLLSSALVRPLVSGRRPLSPDSDCQSRMAGKWYPGQAASKHSCPWIETTFSKHLPHEYQRLYFCFTSVWPLCALRNWFCPWEGQGYDILLAPHSLPLTKPWTDPENVRGLLLIPKFFYINYRYFKLKSNIMSDYLCFLESFFILCSWKTWN